MVKVEIKAVIFGVPRKIIVDLSVNFCGICEIQGLWRRNRISFLSSFYLYQKFPGGRTLVKNKYGITKTSEDVKVF